MLGLIALALTAAAIIGASLCGGVPAVRCRLSAYLLRRTLAAEVAAYTPPRADPRARAHCPVCGRFAHTTSSGPRGTWMRCHEHGLRLRATRRIGKPDNLLIELVPHRGLGAVRALLPVGPLSPNLVHAQTRPADWLDGVLPMPPRLRIAA